MNFANIEGGWNVSIIPSLFPTQTLTVLFVSRFISWLMFPEMSANVFVSWLCVWAARQDFNVLLSALRTMVDYAQNQTYQAQRQRSEMTMLIDNNYVTRRITAYLSNYCRHETRKRLKDRFLIRRNRTKRAHFREVIFFKLHTTIQQKNNEFNLSCVSWIWEAGSFLKNVHVLSCFV